MKSINLLQTEAEQRVKELNLDHYVRECAKKDVDYSQSFYQSLFSFPYEGRWNSLIVEMGEDGIGVRVILRNDLEHSKNFLDGEVVVYEAAPNELRCFRDGDWVDVILEEGRRLEKERKTRREKEKQEREQEERNRFTPLNTGQ